MSPDVPRGHESALVENRGTAASTVALVGQPWGTENKGAAEGQGFAQGLNRLHIQALPPARPAPAGWWM